MDAIHSKRSSILLPLEAAVYGALKELTESIFTQYKNEPISINAFESTSNHTENFADFLIKTVDERAEKTYGRWFRHSDKIGLFNNISIPGFTR